MPGAKASRSASQAGDGATSSPATSAISGAGKPAAANKAWKFSFSLKRSYAGSGREGRLPSTETAAARSSPMSS